MAEKYAPTNFETALALGNVMNRLQRKMDISERVDAMIMQSFLMRDLRAAPKKSYELGDIKRNREIVSELLINVPKDLRRDYLMRISTARERSGQTQDIEAAAIKGVAGELVKIKEVEEAGHQVDHGINRELKTDPIRVEYPAYRGEDHLKWDHVLKKDGEIYQIDPPQRTVRGTIEQIDVPIVVDNLPYVYELKSSGKAVYGLAGKNVNQLLKFNQAVEDGSISGATVDVTGRMDKSFLYWLLQGDVDMIPNVEVVYSLPLPSGGVHRFVLKPSPKSHLLLPGADEAADPSDQLIIKTIDGINKGGKEELVNILSTFKTPKDMQAMRSLIEDPLKITTYEDLQKYLYFVFGSIWRKLLRRGLEQAKKQGA